MNLYTPVFGKQKKKKRKKIESKSRENMKSYYFPYVERYHFQFNLDNIHSQRLKLFLNVSTTGGET